MKRNYKILLAIVLVSATLFAFKLKSEVDPNLFYYLKKGTIVQPL
jgi:hypothetical protein